MMDADDVRTIVAAVVPQLIETKLDREVTDKLLSLERIVQLQMDNSSAQLKTLEKKIDDVIISMEKSLSQYSAVSLQNYNDLAAEVKDLQHRVLVIEQAAAQSALDDKQALINSIKNTIFTVVGAGIAYWLFTGLIPKIMDMIK